MHASNHTKIHAKTRSSPLAGYLFSSSNSKTVWWVCIRMVCAEVHVYPISFVSQIRTLLARSHPFGQNWIRMHTDVIKYVILEEAIKFAWRDLAT